MSGDLIDTTEMYLKTVYELEEEGVPALRARIVERLGQSGPTVSETVARLERDGLLRMGAGRQIHFTDEGFRRAEGVMRRHRLAERLLVDVIGLEWVNVHDEACRWEHAVSDSVADKIEELLHNPERDPFGNPIPRSRNMGRATEHDSEDAVTLAELSKRLRLGEDRRANKPQECNVVRLSERVQAHADDMAMLDSAHVWPGSRLEIVDAQTDEIWVRVIFSADTVNAVAQDGMLYRSENAQSCEKKSLDMIGVSRYIAEGIYIEQAE